MIENKIDKKQLPVVRRGGVLVIVNELPCYVLSSGERVFKFSKLIYALRGVENGKIGNYLDAKNIRKYLPEELKPITDRENDRVPQKIIYFIKNHKIEKGYRCKDFIDICKAFVNALDNGEKLSEVQKIMAYNSYKFIMAASKVDIQKLVDVATGYEIYKKINCIKNQTENLGLNYFGEWNEILPDELWYQVCRLSLTTSKKAVNKSFWTKLLNELIYNRLNEETLEYLTRNKPIDASGIKYLSWMNEKKEVKELMNKAWEVIGLAQTCNTLSELRQMAE